MIIIKENYDEFCIYPNILNRVLTLQKRLVNIYFYNFSQIFLLHLRTIQLGLLHCNFHFRCLLGHFRFWMIIWPWKSLKPERIKVITLLAWYSRLQNFCKYEIWYKLWPVKYFKDSLVKSTYINFSWYFFLRIINNFSATF